MDHIVIIILFMAIVGAILGGSTNYLAIRMLFRPYKPIYIKSWRVPFTPGLIPKRRAEMARQIGFAITNYLLTPEVFKKKFFNDQMKLQVEQFVQKKVGEIVFTDEKTIRDWLEYTGLQQFPDIVNGKVNHVIEKQFEQAKFMLSMKSLDELLPQNMKEKVELGIPKAVSYLLVKGENYLLSPEGEKTIKNLLEDFLNSKGSFGGLIQILFGDSATVIAKIQQEVVKVLQSSSTKNLLVKIFSQEWDKIKEKKGIEFLKEIDLDQILRNLQKYARKELDVEQRLDYSINYYWPKGKNYVNQEIVPKLLDEGFLQVENKLESILKRIDIAEMIREQVDSLSTEKLEELVVGIASRELTLITLLGGLIGGFVGIVQGIIVYLL